MTSAAASAVARLQTQTRRRTGGQNNIHTHDAENSLAYRRPRTTAARRASSRAPRGGAQRGTARAQWPAATRTEAAGRRQPGCRLFAAARGPRVGRPPPGPPARLRLAHSAPRCLRRQRRRRRRAEPGPHRRDWWGRRAGSCPAAPALAHARRPAHTQAWPRAGSPGQGAVFG